MAVLMTPPYVRFFDNSSPSLPLAGGKVYTYAAGTTTPQATYTDNTGNTQNANPVILDANGAASIWLSGSYKFVIEDASGNIIKTVDNISAFATAAAGGLTTESTIASAATTDLGTASGNIIDITGTTTITSFGSSASITSPLYFLRFAGALTLTYDAVALVLPGQANITTAAGDACVAQYMGSGNWKVLEYSPISGVAPLASPAFTGNPTAPTQPANDSSTKIATTAFVNPANSIGTSGYQKFASGLILQWGASSTSAGGSGTINFPLAFPNAAYSCVMTDSIANSPAPNLTALSTTSFSWARGNTGSTSTMYWIAVGK